MVILGILLTIIGGGLFFLHVTGMAATIPMILKIPQAAAGITAIAGIALVIFFRRPAD